MFHKGCCRSSFSASLLPTMNSCRHQGLNNAVPTPPPCEKVLSPLLKHVLRFFPSAVQTCYVHWKEGHALYVIGHFNIHTYALMRPCICNSEVLRSDGHQLQHARPAFLPEARTSLLRSHGQGLPPSLRRFLSGVGEEVLLRGGVRVQRRPGCHGI